jgi:hypothetical protein
MGENNESSDGMVIGVVGGRGRGHVTTELHELTGIGTALWFLNDSGSA